MKFNHKLVIDKSSRIELDASSFINCNSEIIIHENSVLTLDLNEIKNNELNLNFHIYRNSFVNINFFVSEFDSLKLNIHAILLEPGAHILIKGYYLMSDTKKFEIITKQEHKAENTRSDIILKGALFDKSNAYYHGTIRIDKGCENSIASQTNKNILFSQNTKAKSIPSLEVLTNNVKCTHGSAAGFFDKDSLFYLESRGLERKQSYELLLKNFMNYEHFKDKNVKNKLINKISKCLEFIDNN